MVDIHKMLRHLTIWQFCLLTPIAIGAGSYLSLVLADPTFSQTPTPPAASTPTTGGSDKGAKAPSRPLLTTGSQGAEVIELQGVLKLLGYYTGALNGGYDPSTAIAVTQFQKAAGLPADGIVGAETWTRLLPPSPTVISAPKTPPVSAPPKQASANPPAKLLAVPATPSKNSATKSPSATTSTTKLEPVAFPILRIGMQGSAVSGLQERLKALGFLKSASDGVFGAETQAAVKAAQKKFSLASDGVVGAGTWLVLMR
ncbi:peptidoglycan-binding protein [Leptolyngbyaceae cyanobacterium UHCC 1019]